IRVGGIRGADRLARRGDRAVALEDERERRPGGDEVDELAEERLLAMFRVVRLAELARRLEQSRRAQHEPAALEARDDLAREAPPDGVRLRQDQRALDGHAAADSSGSVREFVRADRAANWKKMWCGASAATSVAA